MELLILSIALALSSCSTPTNQSAESTPAAALPSADLSNRAKIGNPAEYEVLDRKVTDQDLRILLKADELLGDESVWNRNDDRACDDDELNGKRSLFCALHKACVEVLGVYDHRRVALQEVRFAVEDVTRGRDFQHRLRDFNNLPETRFADIKAVLAVALKQVRERLNEAEK